MNESQGKRILFLSGVDFKEKSIQVIIKTPEAYARAGWEVHYVVGIDNSVNGDYFYESVINPVDVFVHRFLLPLSQIHGLFNHTYWKALWFRVRNIVLVFMVAYKGIKLIKQKDFDVIYAYEIPGVLALRLIRALRIRTYAKFVIRFQGVLYVKEWLRKKQKFRFLSNPDAILALRTKADLCVMTNDGSQGLKVLQAINAPVKNILFCSNGVDAVKLDPIMLAKVQNEYYEDREKVYLISVSRLDNHKRIDRGIRIIDQIINTFKFKNLNFIIIGGGAEFSNLEKLVEEKGLKQYVQFLGPIKHEFIQYHLALSDIFISMYTSTNVGNPLLEAIRHNKVIVTLNNGDTGEWIQHKVNGLIYDVDDDRDLRVTDYRKIAKDVVDLLNDENLLQDLKSGLKKIEAKKLWTWAERFDAELARVNLLLNQ